MPTTLVNINHRDALKRKPHFDVYIGRRETGMHYGNPFTWENTPSLATIKVSSRKDAVQCYDEWLHNAPMFAKVEPERRAWILSHREELRGKTLGCFCVPDLCHGTVLIKLLEEKDTK